MENRLGWIWPEIIDDKSAEKAAKQGFWAALYCSGATILFVVLANFEPQFDAVNMYALTDAFLFTIIGFGIWRMSRTASVAGLLLYMFERAYAWTTSGPKNPIIALIFVLLFIHSIRGTFAYHNFKKEEIEKPQAKELASND